MQGRKCCVSFSRIPALAELIQSTGGFSRLVCWRDGLTSGFFHKFYEPIEKLPLAFEKLCMG